MRYEITLNGKVYEVEVDDNRALLGAIEQARPLSDEELAQHPALAHRMASNITRAASAPRPVQGRPAQGRPVQGRPVQGHVVQGRPAQAGTPQAKSVQGGPATGGPVRVAQGGPGARSAAPGGPVARPAAGATPAAAKGEPVSAPMPGLIKEIKVAPGQQIKAGQVLIILEAMKMENEIVAPKDATVTAVSVSKGQTVSAGAPLLSLG